MKLKHNFLLAGLTVVLSLFFPLTSAQTSNLSVRLRVKHNGALVSSPKKVTLIFGKESLTLPLKTGQFEVPTRIVSQKEVRLLTKVGNERISISGIAGNAFHQDEWTLLLADREYDSDNRWVVPKGASVRSSCILSFESKSAEGTALFAPHCRFRTALGNH